MSRRLRSASGQPPRSNSRLPAPSEVIVISSDEDDHQSMPQRKRARREGKSVASSRAPAASSKNPIVISSDDDTPRRRKKSASVTELEMKLKALEEENTRLRNEVKQTRSPLSSEIVKQAELYKALVSNLDDSSSCEICTMRMWTPYTLKCGHSFCQVCLKDWFETTFTKFKEDHPNYHNAIRGLEHYYAMLRSPRLPAHERRYLESQIRITLQTIGQPTYTCPTCRVPVKEQPSEIYSFKQMVQAYAETLGETAPKKVLPPRGSKESAGPWDKFFPVIPPS